MKYTLIEDGNRSSLVVFYSESNELIPYNASHEKWDDMLELAKSGKLDAMTDNEFLSIITSNIPHSINTLSSISDRVQLGSRGATLDGLPIDEELAKGIKAVLGSEEISDSHLDAIKNFLDKADDNPSMENSSKLYRWIASEKLTLAPDGDFIGYKSVYSVPDDKLTVVFPESTTLPNGDTPIACADVLANKNTDIFRSTVNGGGITDGVEFPGYVPNYVGAVVEMPRDKVDSNGRVECSVGLHVGTYGYASTFSGDHMLLVKVNPRDVVSVPEYDFSKLRSCRYTVIGSGVSGQLDSHVYIDEQFAPIVGESAPVHTDDEKGNIISRIIERIKSSKN